jgi:hypothetical protein
MVQGAIDIISFSSVIDSVYAGKSKAPAVLASVGPTTKLRAAGYEVKEYSALAEPVVWTSSSREPNGPRNEDPTVLACTQVSKAINYRIQR